MSSMTEATKTAPSHAVVQPPGEEPTARQVRDLKREIRELKESLGATKGHLTKAERTIEKLRHQPPTPRDDAESGTDKEKDATVSSVASTGSATPSREHVVEWQPRYCPECATKNESFKDEVKCEGCGIGLGSEEYAHNKMKACPNCGERHYKPLPGFTPKYPAPGR